MDRRTVGPPARDAFARIVCWNGDVRGEFLCAWGKEELMVGAAKDASGVGVDVYVDNLRVVGTSDVDEGVELEAEGALKGGEHGVGKWVLK